MSEDQQSKDQRSGVGDQVSEHKTGLAGFWAELKRRKVVRVAVTYAVVGWLIIQVANATFGEFGIPIWAYRFVVLMVLLGFPLALILAWAFELTPEGIKTTKHAVEARGGAPDSKQQQKKRNWMAYATGAIIPTVIFGVLALVFYVREGTKDSTALPSIQTEIEYEKSIAVLPFTNMSANEEHAYFADGVHETILTDLANLRELRVVSRTSVLPYRDSNKSMKTIGEELGVAYILEGSMQRAGNQFRLTAQLIDSRKDGHLWAKNFTGELTDIFSVQSQLARDVANGLQAILSPQEEQQIDRPKSANIEAYDLYLMALKLLSDMPRENSEAVELLQESVELDPTFTDAWLQISRWKGQYFMNGFDRSNEAEKQIERAIDTAVSLEPNNPNVLLGLGLYYYQCHRDYSRARFYVDQVLERLPQHAWARFTLGAINRREGNWKDCVYHFDRAHLLDPNEVEIIRNYAVTYRFHRQWEKAMELLNLLPDIPSGDSVFNRYVRTEMEFRIRGSTKEVYQFFADKKDDNKYEGYYYYWLFLSGDLEALESEAILEKWQEEDYRAPLTAPLQFEAIMQAMVLCILRETDQAEQILKFIIDEAETRIPNSREDYLAHINLGMAHAIKGNLSKAHEALDKAFSTQALVKDAFIGANQETNRAIALAWMGEKDKAVLELNQLVSRPGTGIYYQRLKNDLSFYPLRDHQGFQELLENPKLDEPIPLINR